MEDVAAEIPQDAVLPIPPTSPALPEIPINANLLDFFGLTNQLNDMRNTKLHSSFSHYLTGMPTNEDCPIKPRCRAGSLMELVNQPEDEDIRKLEEFDERVLRNALTLKESDELVPLPEWLNDEQAWTTGEKRRRRKKKRRRKRKRNGEGDGENGDEHRRKRRRKDIGDPNPAPSPSP